VTVTASGEPARLAAELHSVGDLSAECIPAFQAVARDLFIPDHMWVQEVDGGPYRPVDRAVEPARWLANVYADRVIVTQFDDGATVWPDVGTRPTCSASMPSVVTGMLAELGAQPGESVLEIGTGTGFNAALLAELVGTQGSVTTVEIDPTMGAAARQSLDAAGYSRVIAHVQDAATVALGGVFDRVIATAGVHLGQLPYSWVAGTRPGGVILAPMRADLASGPLVRLRVGEDGMASGHAVSMRVGFMEVRSHRVASLPVGGLRWDDDTAAQSRSNVSPFTALLNESARWAIAVAVPSCRYSLEKRTPERDHGIAWLTDPLSGSWASVVPDDDGPYRVRQSGPRALWDEAERAIGWWTRNGEPRIEDWTWTVTPDRQSVTLM
jgi:protein-L-isoaspartate O-methyltransferase